MAQPHLPDLLIEGYRGLRRLELKKLGNVNLIVGRNGVGKTSVLEAVRLYASSSLHNVLRDIGSSRDEIDSDSESRVINAGDLVSLFYGRPDSRRQNTLIRIGGTENPVLFSIEWLMDGPEHFEPIAPETITPSTKAYQCFVKRQEPESLQMLSLDSQYGIRGQNVELPLDGNDGFLRRDVHYLNSRGLTNSDFAALWDKIVLTPDEELLNLTLSNLDSKIARVALAKVESGSTRLPFVKLHNSSSRVPIRSLGEGMYRFLSVALSLVNARDGFLLIDEFENGLHYTTQEALWRFVIRTARELNVQVFATTHSRDCIGAFGRATNDDPQSDGVLTRLEQSGDGVIAKQLEEEDILIAAENLVEIR